MSYRLLAIIGVVLAGLATWLVLRGKPLENRVSRREEEAPAPVVQAPPVPPRRAPAPPTPAAAEPEVVTSDGLPIMPPRGEPSGPVHPHPITPQHQRLYAENRLVSALNGAMDVKDVPAMRRMLEQYRREYPEDDNLLQDGYAVIADCFEHPGDASRAAAERWLASHNGSTLKRFVNRHCLEQ